MIKLAVSGGCPQEPWLLVSLYNIAGGLFVNARTV